MVSVLALTFFIIFLFLCIVKNTNENHFVKTGLNNVDSSDAIDKKPASQVDSKFKKHALYFSKNRMNIVQYKLPHRFLPVERRAINLAIFNQQ